MQIVAMYVLNSGSYLLEYPDGFTMEPVSEPGDSVF